MLKSISLNQRPDNIEFACQYVEPERALALLKSFRETQLVIGLETETELPLWYQFRYGLSLLELGSTDEAIKMFQRLTRSTKDKPVMWECLAEAYVQRGSLKTALKAYQFTAELYEKEESLDKLAKVKFRIGQLYLETLEVDQALEVFESIESKSGEVYIGMAQVSNDYFNLFFNSFSYKGIKYVFRPITNEQKAMQSVGYRKSVTGILRRVSICVFWPFQMASKPSRPWFGSLLETV